MNLLTAMLLPPLQMTLFTFLVQRNLFFGVATSPAAAASFYGPQGGSEYEGFLRTLQDETECDLNLARTADVTHCRSHSALFACGINKSRFSSPPFAVWKLLGKHSHHPLADLEPSFGFTKVSE